MLSHINFGEPRRASRKQRSRYDATRSQVAVKGFLDAG